MIQGDISVLVAMALFGTYSLFLRWFPAIPVVVFLFAFQLVGALGFGVAHYVSKASHPGRVSLLLLAVLALVATGNDLCYFLAFRLTSVANAAIAHQNVSAFLVVLAPWLLGERTAAKEWVAFLVSLAGVIVLYSAGVRFGPGDVTGISLALLSALFYALLIILYKRLSQSGLSIPTINWFRYLFSTFLILPLLYTEPLTRLLGSDLVVLAMFGVLFAVIASGVHIYGMTKTRALHVSILGKTEPVFACAYAAMFLNERLSLPQLVGGGLILGAGLWLTMHGSNVSKS